MSKAQISLCLLFSLPVALAFAYETSAGKIAVASSLIAILIFTYALTALTAKIEAASIRQIIELFSTTLIAVFLYVQFVSYFFQGTYVNQQFLFHANFTTLQEAPTLYYPLVIGFVAWIVGVVLVTFVFRKEPRRSRLPAPVLVIALVMALFLDPSTRGVGVTSLRAAINSTPVTIESIEWDNLELNRQAIGPQVVAASPGKNVVFIFLEGVEQIYTESNLFPELTPVLNTLASQGQQLTNLEQVDGSQWTMGGLVSSLCGTPLLYEAALSGNSVMFTRFLDRAICLPDILAAAGYEQVFMGGASTQFAGKGEFLAQHGYDRVLGRDELAPRLPDQSYMGGWGLFDDSLFALAAEEYVDLAESGKPFNLTLLTVDTHHPAGEVSSSCSPYPVIDNPILHAVHCTDYLLGEFLQKIRRHPAYENTAVVLVSDHLALPNEAYPLFPQDYERRLFFTVLNAARDIGYDDRAVAMDIAPTVLTLMEVEHDAGFLVGKDLSDPGNRERRGDWQNPLRNNVIAHLNSSYLSSDERSTLLYALDTNYVGDIEFSNDVVNVEANGSSLQFDAIGEDPFLILPAFDIPADQTLQLFIDIESPANTSVDVFYSPDGQPHFSESRKLTRGIPSGRTRLAFVFDDGTEAGRIRIDPGLHEGHYVIRLIQVRASTLQD